MRVEDLTLQRRPRAARHDPRLQDPDQGDRAGAVVAVPYARAGNHLGAVRTLRAYVEAAAIHRGGGVQTGCAAATPSLTSGLTDQSVALIVKRRAAPARPGVPRAAVRALAARRLRQRRPPQRASRSARSPTSPTSPSCAATSPAHRDGVLTTSATAFLTPALRTFCRRAPGVRDVSSSAPGGGHTTTGGRRARRGPAATCRPLRSSRRVEGWCLWRRRARA